MNTSQNICPFCRADIKPGARFCTSCGREVSPAADITDTEVALPSAARTLKHPMSKAAKRSYAVLALFLFLAFGYVFFTHLPGGANPVIANQPEVAMASMFTDVKVSPQTIDFDRRDGKIIFPLSLLQQFKMVQFDYQNGKTTVPVLAYISPEGKLVTSIRMCEPCNSTRFTIEGTELACGNCETRWKLNNLEGVQGSCQKYPPAPIPSTVVGNYVQIEESVLRNWKMRI